MKRIFLILTLLGCGEATAPTAPMVAFAVESTCRQRLAGPQNFIFQVDGKTIGTERLDAGQQSKPYVISAGIHRFSVVVSSNLQWDSYSTVVDRGQFFMYRMSC